MGYLGGPTKPIIRLEKAIVYIQVLQHMVNALGNRIAELWRDFDGRSRKSLEEEAPTDIVEQEMIDIRLCFWKIGSATSCLRDRLIRWQICVMKVLQG